MKVKLKRLEIENKSENEKKFSRILEKRESRWSLGVSPEKWTIARKQKFFGLSEWESCSPWHTGDKLCWQKSWLPYKKSIRFENSIFHWIGPKNDSIQNSKQNREYSFKKNIHSIEFRIFNRIIHSRKMRKIIQNSKIRPKYGYGALLRPLYR